MKKPQGSTRLYGMASRGGSRPVTMRPPSSGGSGNMLSANITTFTSTPARHISTKKRSCTPRPASTIRPMAQPSAMMKLLAGPASATQIMSRLGLRRLPKFTGTGLA